MCLQDALYSAMDFVKVFLKICIIKVCLKINPTSEEDWFNEFVLVLKNTKKTRECTECALGDMTISNCVIVKVKVT